MAAGILAVDRMLKKSPVALLRCGTVHPGRYLALVGGSVASTEEAHAAGVTVGCDHGALWRRGLPAGSAPAAGRRGAGRAARRPRGEALGVVEVSTSPGLLRAIDAALKAVPVDLVEIRLADDLGGRALAVFDGSFPDVQEALGSAARRRRRRRRAGWAATVLPRLDDTLRDVLAAGTRFAACRIWEPAGAETVED